MCVFIISDSEKREMERKGNWASDLSFVMAKTTLARHTPVLGLSQILSPLNLTACSFNTEGLVVTCGWKMSTDMNNGILNLMAVMIWCTQQSKMSSLWLNCFLKTVSHCIYFYYSLSNKTVSSPSHRNVGVEQLVYFQWTGQQLSLPYFFAGWGERPALCRSKGPSSVIQPDRHQYGPPIGKNSKDLHLL